MAIAEKDRRPDPNQDVVIEGHNYDGIREYDNPMPGWWLGIFWATVVFAPIYILGVHVFGFVNTYEDDLASGQSELREMREAHDAANPTFTADEPTLQAYVDDAVQKEAGATIFATNCAPCHGAAGQGLIGPNLTDRYWIHGGRNTDLFRVITDGVIEKGMTPWSNILSPEQRAQVIAFIRSIAGTEPEGAKEPQGELYEGA